MALRGGCEALYSYYAAKVERSIASCIELSVVTRGVRITTQLLR